MELRMLSRRRSSSAGKWNIHSSTIHHSRPLVLTLRLPVCGPYLIPIWASDANEIKSFNYSCVDFCMNWCKPTMLCVRLTDPFSNSEYAELLQFDHQVHVLHFVPDGVRRAIPWRVEGRYGRREDRAFGIPPAAADEFRAVDSYEVVVVHCRRRKFLPVVRHRTVRMKVFEYVVCSTGNTTHNITCNVLALGLNNNRALKSQIDENV